MKNLCNEKLRLAIKLVFFPTWSTKYLHLLDIYLFIDYNYIIIYFIKIIRENFKTSRNVCCDVSAITIEDLLKMHNLIYNQLLSPSFDELGLIFLNALTQNMNPILK